MPDKSNHKSYHLSRGVITAIIRFVVFYTVDLPSDLTYLITDAMTVSVIEPGAYFICSCLPGICPLMRVLYKKMRTSNSGRGSDGGSGGVAQPSRRNMALGAMGGHRGGFSTPFST